MIQEFFDKHDGLTPDMREILYTMVDRVIDDPASIDAARNEVVDTLIKLVPTGGALRVAHDSPVGKILLVTILMNELLARVEMYHIVMMAVRVITRGK